jgi:hypothetical protein
VPGHPQLYPWADRVATAFPELPPATAVVLALWSLGLVWPTPAGSPRWSSTWPRCWAGRPTPPADGGGSSTKPADRNRGANRTGLDPAACCGPLVRWVTAGWADKRVAPALGATSPADRFCVRTAAVAYRGCAVPAAWAVLPANTPGAWHSHGVATSSGSDRPTPLSPQGGR